MKSKLHSPVLLASLLLAALAAFAPPASAQRTGSYGSSASFGGTVSHGAKVSFRGTASYGNHGSPGSLSASYLRGGYASSRVWVPGHYETVAQRVFVPGPIQRVWIAPVHEWRFGLCGARYVCVRAGYWKNVQAPGRYEVQHVRVYTPGCWVARGSCD